MWTTICEKYSRDGISGLCSAAIPFFIEECRRFGRLCYGMMQFHISDTNVVSHHGVAIDLGEPVLTESLRRHLLRDSYEQEERRIYQRYLDGIDYDIVELGGGIGYISCIINNSIAKSAEHVVYEANDELIPVLERTHNLNNANFTIRNKAYSPDRNRIKFYKKSNLAFSSAHQARRSEQVIWTDSVSISNIKEENGFPEFILCGDIEGAEFQMIDQELSVLSESCPLVVLELHEFTDNDITEYEHKLTSAGFELLEQRGRVRVFKNTEF